MFVGGGHDGGNGPAAGLAAVLLYLSQPTAAEEPRQRDGGLVEPVPSAAHRPELPERNERPRQLCRRPAIGYRDRFEQRHERLAGPRSVAGEHSRPRSLRPPDCRNLLSL